MESFSEHSFCLIELLPGGGYICGSFDRTTEDFDKFAESIKNYLVKENVKDVVEAEHKTINVVSDHGTSKDRFRTIDARASTGFVRYRKKKMILVCSWLSVCPRTRRNSISIL